MAVFPTHMDVTQTSKSVNGFQLKVLKNCLARLLIYQNLLVLIDVFVALVRHPVVTVLFKIIYSFINQSELMQWLQYPLTVASWSLRRAVV